MDKYDEQVALLENEELEHAESNANLYIRLMAYYLTQNKLFDAKFLWSRIPQSIKTGNFELHKLSDLYRNLSSNNLAEVIKVIDDTDWSEELKVVMEDLRESTMKNIFHLIGNAYTSIMDNTLSELTNLKGNQYEVKCAEYNWNIESHDQLTIIHPKKPNPPEKNTAESEYQLSKLTEFVSFLEN